MRGKRVLIVDDDPDIIDYLSSFLEDHGYEVGAATSVGSALTMVEEFRPHAVLVDIVMRRRSGLNLLVTLRKDPRHDHVRLIVITGHDRILEDECQSYLGSHEGLKGPDGVLGKPVDRDALLAMLEHAKECECEGDSG